MGIKKLINDVKEYLGIDELKKSGKKKSLKEIIEKLEEKKQKIKKKIKNAKSNKKKESLKEEYTIIALQIKKSKKILKKLNE